MRDIRTLLISYVILGSLLFITLSVYIKSNSYFPLDLYISRNIQSINFSGFAGTMTFLSNSGWGMLLYSIIAIMTVLLFVLGKRLSSVFIIFISILDTILFFGIANLVNRARPSAGLIRVDFKITVGGYPSGHVLLYTLLFGFLIYISTLYIKNRFKKLFTITTLLILIVLMGVARIYSGQHWPSDVFAAYLLATIWLIVIIYFYNIAKVKNIFGSKITDLK